MKYTKLSLWNDKCRINGCQVFDGKLQTTLGDLYCHSFIALHRGKQVWIAFKQGIGRAECSDTVFFLNGLKKTPNTQMVKKNANLIWQYKIYIFFYHLHVWILF